MIPYELKNKAIGRGSILQNMLRHQVNYRFTLSIVS